MGIKINVDINNLSTDCNKINGLLTEAESFIKKISSASDELGQMWEGPAKDEFMKNISSDIAESISILEKFGFVSNAMKTALNIYNNSSEEAVNIFIAADK